MNDEIIQVQILQSIRDLEVVNQVYTRLHKVRIPLDGQVVVEFRTRYKIMNDILLSFDAIF